MTPTRVLRATRKADKEMKPVKITKSRVDAIEAPEKNYVVYQDTAITGFGVRVMASGVKSYVLERRIKGKSRRITIGKCADITADKARKEAERLVGEIALHKDPVADKKRTEAQNTTLSEAFQQYLATRTLKPTTVKDTERAMKSLSDWMSKPLLYITPDMVRKRHQKLAAKSGARANLTMRYLRAIINFAAAEHASPDGTPLIAYNPVKKLSEVRTWAKVNRRQTVIKSHQIKPWLSAVYKLRSQAVQDYFTFALLTGLRRTEAVELNWDQVDLIGRTFTLQDTKAHREHTLPLSDHLYEILKRRKAQAVSQWVFTNKKGKLISDFRHSIESVEKRSGVSFCISDLRRTFITVAESLDISAYALKRLLNHATGSDVTAGYIVLDVERLRAPMQMITNKILQLGGMKGECAEILDIGTRDIQ